MKKQALLQRVLTVVALVMCGLIAVAQNYSGTWKGSITAGPYTIPVALNIQQSAMEQ